MTQDEARRLLEALYPEHRERAPFAAELVRRWIDGAAIGLLLAEAVRALAPTTTPLADATPIPETVRTGADGSPGRD